MNSSFPYLEIPKALKAVVGDADLGTRIYRREGSDEDVGLWYEAICEAFADDNFVTPGGVSMFAAVSRAGVHKRLKEGKLTAFMFHVVEKKRTMFGYQKNLKYLPYGYIPVSECKAWAMELEARPERRQAEANGDGDFEGRFLDKDPKDSKDKTVKYEHEEITAEGIKLLVQVVAEETISRLLPKKLMVKREQKQLEEMLGRTARRKEKAK